jgi:hypothetical protein
MHGETTALAPAPKEIALPREVLARYVGTYAFRDGDCVLTLECNHLIARYGATFPLFPESETKFFSKEFDMEFESSKNDKGEFAFVAQHFDGKR